MNPGGTELTPLRVGFKSPAQTRAASPNTSDSLKLRRGRVAADKLAKPNGMLSFHVVGVSIAAGAAAAAAGAVLGGSDAGVVFVHLHLSLKRLELRAMSISMPVRRLADAVLVHSVPVGRRSC